MKFSWVLVVLAMTGCSSDATFKIKGASCSAGVTDWYPDLTFHILQGPKDGSFAYEPSGVAVNNLVGQYELATGDFDWSESYDETHYLTEKMVDGYGYANINGDLDIIGTESYSDISDQTWDIKFRINRVGCEMEVRREFNVDGDPVERVETGTFENNEYVYTRTTDRGAYIKEEQGSINSNLEYTNTETTVDSGFSYIATTVGKMGEGTSVESFLQESSSAGETREYEGTIERFMTGGRAVNYDVRIPGETTGTWDYELDYFGTGSGTYTAGNTTCTIEFDEGVCSYDCGGGNNGSC